MLLSRSKDHIEKFRGYLNCQHSNIKFTSETEENSSISFLDIKIKRVHNNFSANIYHKVTFSGVFTNFQSFIPISCNSNLIFTLLYRAFKIKIGSVRPSILPCFRLSVRLSGRFLQIVSLTFSKFWNGTRNLNEVVRDRARFSRKLFLLQKWGKWAKSGQKRGFFEFIGKFSR